MVADLHEADQGHGQWQAGHLVNDLNAVEILPRDVGLLRRDLTDLATGEVASGHRDQGFSAESLVVLWMVDRDEGRLVVA